VTNQERFDSESEKVHAGQQRQLKPENKKKPEEYNQCQCPGRNGAGGVESSTS